MRLLIVILTLCCTATALQHSNRMQALGTDLAHLIPDYETDLYRNPCLLDRRLAGLSFEPMLFYRYGSSIYPYVVVNQMPVTLRLLNKSMGMTGQYWINYTHDLEPHEYGWRSSTFNAIRLNDLWMYRVRKAVINLYNDLDYSKITYLNSANSESIEKRTEYIVKTQISLPIRKRLSLDLKLGYGLYETCEEIDGIDIHKRRINMGLFRIGLYCRNVSKPNDFTSWYLDIGSPVTNAEIDSLPYSAYAHLADSETRFVIFAQTMTARLAIARALPVSNHGFLAVGIKNSLLFQNTSDHAEALDLRGIKNTMALPLGFEYRINTVALRFGARFRYDFGSLRAAADHEVREQSIEHEFGYDYSFGLGWQPHKSVALDLFNSGDLTYLRNWALYIKYVF